MKRYSVFFVVICLMSIVMEVRSQQKLYIGIVSGLNLTNLNIHIVGNFDPEVVELNPDLPDQLSENPESDIRTTFGFGGVLDLSLAKNFGLRLEPMYLQKGDSNKRIDPDSGEIKSRTKLSYFELPVLAKITLGSGITRPYFTVGPTIGWLLSAKAEFEDGQIRLENDIKNTTKKIDFGIVIGAGVSFSVKKSTLFLEGRLVKGLVNIDDLGSFLGYERSIKTNGLQLMTGIIFPFGG